MRNQIPSPLLKQSRSHSGGAILIVTIWVLAALSIFALGVSKRASSGIKIAGRIYDDLRVRYLAKASARKIALEFQKDPTPNYDSLYEYSLAGNTIDFGDNLSADYTIADEERLLNLNIATKEMLERIGFLPDTASSAIDWRDPDSAPLPGGAEDSYYKGLTPPYECKDSSFEALEELLLVRGITQDIFNEIKDKLTLAGDGRMNINTADIEHLSALGITQGLVDKIIFFRKGDDGTEGTEDDNIFQNISSIQSDIERITGPLDVTESNQLAQLLPYLSVRSNFLKADITLTYGEKIIGRTEAIIDRTTGRIIYRSTR